jgi:hypothetical protein
MISSILYTALICSAFALPSENTCVLPTKITNFNPKSIAGKWYVYQHQPDFVEGTITLGCRCTWSNLTDLSPASGLGISNICNYFSPTGPIVKVITVNKDIWHVGRFLEGADIDWRFGIQAKCH